VYQVPKKGEARAEATQEANRQVFEGFAMKMSN
jgi:hypothetical protein